MPQNMLGDKLTMGRPTDEVKSHIVKCRIGDTLYDRIKGDNMSEVIRNALDGFVTHNNYVPQKESNVPQNIDDSVTQNVVKQLQERITELEADNATKQERIAELEFLNNPDYVEQLENRIKELESQSTVLSLSYDTEIELKDTLRMIELSSSKEQVPLFLKNLHDRLESGEFQIENGKLKLGYSEVFDILNRAETKKWLSSVWEACKTKKKTYQEGLRMVFCEGAKKAVEIIYGED